jgi:hypothetical protein
MIFKKQFFPIIGEEFQGILGVKEGFFIVSIPEFLRMESAVQMAAEKEAKLDELVEKRARYIALNYIGIKEKDLENILSSQSSNPIS